MKYLIVFLFFGFISCKEDSKISGNEPTNTNQNEADTSIATEDVKRVKPPTYIVGDLEVMTEDFGWMTLFEAEDSLKSEGSRWRLPTKDELIILFKNRKKIGGFDDSDWYLGLSRDGETAWAIDFNNGGIEEADFFVPENIRTVRDKQ